MRRPPTGIAAMVRRRTHPWRRPDQQHHHQQQAHQQRLASGWVQSSSATHIACAAATSTGVVFKIDRRLDHRSYHSQRMMVPVVPMSRPLPSIHATIRTTRSIHLTTSSSLLTMLPTHPGNGSLSNEYDAALLAAAGSINNTDGDDADDSVDAVLDRIAHDLSSAVEAILLFHDHLPPSEQDGGSSSSSGPPNGDSTRRFRDVTRPRSIRDAYHRNWKFAQRFDPTMAHGDRASYGYERDHLSEEDEESGLTSSSSTFSASLVPPLLSRSDGTSSTIATTTTSSSTSTNSSKKFAIFHALKNDYQVGGHVEEVIRLPTKADPIPSFLVNSSTATIPPTDTVELDSLDWLDDHLPLETGNPKNDDIAVSPSLPPIDSSSHPPTTPEALATTTATMEQGVVLPEKEPFADMFVVGHWNQPPLFNENLNNTALFTSDATSHHTIRSEDIANHHPVQPGSPPPLSPHVSSSDVVLETKDSSNDTNIIEEESRKLSLTNWFQSTFAVEPEGQSKHIDNVDDRNHNNDTHDARVLSQSEQARQDAVTRALVLLRTLNEGNWTDFDKPASLVASTTVPETAHPNLGAILEEETIAEIGGDESLIVDGAVDLTTSAPTADSEDSIAETFAGLSDLLHASRLGQAHLTTLDFNTLLARVAIATDLTPDECLSALMTTYRQMTDLANAGYECKPNAMTYEILLLSLTHRFSAFQSAVDLVVAMTASSSVSMWTPKTLEAIMMLCERKNLRRLAEKILSDLDRSNELSVIEIPKRAYLSMINILKTDDVRKPLSNVLQIALKRASQCQDESLDAVFVQAIKWPTQNRHLKAIDNTSVIGDILNILEQEKIYIAGYAVWKQIVLSSSHGAKENECRWMFVIRSLRQLAASDPTYWPDHVLMKHGLAASEVLLDSELASDLIWRAATYYRVPSPALLGLAPPEHSNAPVLSPLYIKAHLPYQDIVRAMTICLSAKDMVSCTKILRSTEKLVMLPVNTRDLYLLCLKGFANVGDACSAEKLVSEMNEKKISLEDDTYGSLLYAHGVANQLENARTLLYSLESGEMGIRPGSICYDGYILGCIRSKAWDDVAAAFRSMQKTQVQPSPAACHGILLASLRRGGRLEAKLCLEALRAAGAPLRGEGMILAFKAMLRDSGKINESIGTISGIRNYLRATVESDPSIKTSSCVELIRTLRIAELEDQREETRGLSMQAILSRQDVAWQGVFQSLIAYFDAVDSHEERGSATTQIL